MAESFAQFIRKARKLRSLTQSQLAKDLGGNFTQTRLSGWETGRSPNLSQDEIARLAEKLDIERDALERVLESDRMKNEQSRTPLNAADLLEAQDNWFEEHFELLPDAVMTVVSPQGLALRTERGVQESWGRRCANGLTIRVLWLDELMPLESEGAYQLWSGFRSVGNAMRETQSKKPAQQKGRVEHYIIEMPPGWRVGRASALRRRTTAEFVEQLALDGARQDARYFGQSAHIVPLTNGDSELALRLLLFHNVFGAELLYEMPRQAPLFCLGVDNPGYSFPSEEAPSPDRLESLRALTHPHADNQWAGEFHETLVRVTGTLALHPGTYALAKTSSDAKTLQRLATSESWLVRAALAANPALPQTEMFSMCNARQAIEVRLALAGNPRISSDVVDTLCHDQDPEVKLALLQLDELGAEAASKLIDDDDPGVKSRAIVRLSSARAGKGTARL